MLEKEFQASRMMKILGNPTRFMVVKQLLRESLTPSQIGERLGRKPNNISQHLIILRNSNIVRFQTVGGNVFYRIKNKKVEDLITSAEACV